MSDDGFAEAIAKLEVAEKFFRALGDTVELRIELPEEDVEKAAHLAAQGRDFFEITPELSEAIIAAVQKKIDEDFEGYSSAPSVFEIMVVAAEAARDAFVERFDKQSGTGMSPLTELSRAWLLKKLREGKPSLIGQYTSDLRNNTAVSRITFV